MKTISSELQEKLIKTLAGLTDDPNTLSQNQYDDVLELLEELRPKRVRRKVIKESA